MMDSKTFMIPTMTADDATLIEAELGKIEGVRGAQVYLPTHSVTVTWSAPATWDDIGKRLTELKFTPDLPQGF